jgi:NtrC-family two-component system response regulator AlgB
MAAKCSILLVDDESNILETLRLVFEREGYKVATATSSAEAVGLIKRNGRFDAVITDLNMEKEDIGLEVARVAMKSKPRPAVVICTGFASMANSRAALQMGVDYMAHKPVELTDLISALNRLISKHRQLGGADGR